MTNLLTTLSAADCQRGALAMEQLEKRRESFNDVMRHEEEWSRRSFGFFARMRFFLQERAIRRNAVVWYQSDAREARRLALQLAARSFALERGQKPKRVSDLVPELLRAIPLDPATQTPLELP